MMENFVQLVFKDFHFALMPVMASCVSLGWLRGNKKTVSSRDSTSLDAEEDAFPAIWYPHAPGNGKSWTIQTCSLWLDSSVLFTLFIGTVER